MRAATPARAALPTKFRLLAFLVSMVPSAIAVYGLLALRRLFTAYRDGAIFAVGNALELRTFAFSVVGSVLVNIVTGPVLSVIVSWHNPPGIHERRATHVCAFSSLFCCSPRTRRLSAACWWARCGQCKPRAPQH